MLAAPVALAFGDEVLEPFALPGLALVALGALLWVLGKGEHPTLLAREGFLLTALTWLSLSAAGCLPFYLYPGLDTSLTDAFFESVSGITTTGASVFKGLDYWPKSLLLYRQALQWIGGMGLVLVAVALLPLLGIGGMRFYRTEASSAPMIEQTVAAKIGNTAKNLWLTYTALTVVCGLAYWVFGMSAYDALAHAFSTVSIGGFSTHDKNFGYFDAPALEAVAAVFMLLASINFALHIRCWQKRSLAPWKTSEELKFFAVWILVIAALVVLLLIVLPGGEQGFWRALRYGLFQAISIATTTGYSSQDFASWPVAIVVLLALAAFVGGCAGSTSGGVKSVRALLLFKQARRELKHLLHPEGVYAVTLDGRRLDARLTNSVWAFFAVYSATFLSMMVTVLIMGTDFQTAFSAVVACLNNLGPGFGGISGGYGNLTVGAKLALSFCMILGRLEIFALLVILTKEFWRT